MAIREGLWDCPQCGHKGNRGSEVKCGACKKVRADEVQFYLPDDAAEVGDEAALARAEAGADWICEFCGATTPAAEKRCKSCSAAPSGKLREQKEILDAPPPPAAPPAAAKPKSSKRGATVAILALLATVGSCFALCRAKETPMTLERVSWERTVEVEKYGTVVEEDWRDELPAGARIQSTERRVHHTNKVQTGTRQTTKKVTEKVKTGTRKVKAGKKDLGNGYFKDIYKDEPVFENRERTVTENEPVYREDPVYADWCRYEVEKWARDRVERAAAEDASPRWPQVAEGPTQRPGKKAEKYLAFFRDADGKEHEWAAPLDKWQGLEAGRKYKLVTRLGNIQGLAETQ